MTRDAQLILAVGTLLAVGVLAAGLAARIRLPALVLFAGLGMLVGSDGLGFIPFDNYRLARLIGTIALVLILYEGGLAAGWSEVRPVLRPALLLAVITKKRAEDEVLLGAELVERPHRNPLRHGDELRVAKKHIDL